MCLLFDPILAKLPSLEAVASLAQGGGRDSATAMVAWIHFANRRHGSDGDEEMIFVNLCHESKCLRLSITSGHLLSARQGQGHQVRGARDFFAFGKA